MNAQLLYQTRFRNFIGLLLLAAFALACGGSPSASDAWKYNHRKDDNAFGSFISGCFA